MVQRKYEFNYGEPGLFMEIYVAKKAEFQPLLYQTLTAGFDLKKVRAHFRSNAEAIRGFMRRNQQFHNFSSYRIDHFGNVFTGYSLYEVDYYFPGYKVHYYPFSSLLLGKCFARLEPQPQT